MDVPSPAAGTVKEVLVKVKIGDSVGEGSVLLLIEAAEAPLKPHPQHIGHGSATEACSRASCTSSG